MIKEYFLRIVDLFYSLIWVFGLIIVGVVALFFFGRSAFASFPQFTPFINLLIDFAPFWVPLILGIIFFKVWMSYIRYDFVLKSGSVLLEIKIPKETFKSPLAMEIFFTSLYQTGSATFSELYWIGKVRPWFSLELASIGGQVKFFIWSAIDWTCRSSVSVDFLEYRT